MRERIFQNQFAGFEVEDDRHLIFFGSRHMAKESLPELYPQFHFAFLKQTHGTQVVEGSPTVLTEGDAQYSSHPHLALVIQTADCIPAFFSDERSVWSIGSSGPCYFKHGKYDGAI